MEDPLYKAEAIPTLLSKIGALTVRNEMLQANIQELIAEIRRLREKYEPEEKTVETEVELETLSPTD